MNRTAVSALMILFVLVAGAEAQRAGGGVPHGGVVPMGIVGQHPTSQNGFMGGRRSFRHSHDVGSIFVPYVFGVDESFGYEQPYAEPVADAKSPVIISQPNELKSRVPEPLPAEPKLIEIPGVASSPSHEVQPAIFVLLDGKRLETLRYTLTAENLSVNIDRKQTVIPTSMLDLNATVVANRKRGIELRIPEDRNEISLSF